MTTVVLEATPEAIRQGGALIRAGGLVAFPTETVYGLGADALNPDAVRAIFRAKGRPGDNPLIAHVAALSQVEILISGGIGPVAARLAQAFWPGPLTMIFPKNARVPDAVTAGLDTVAVRFPAHQAALKLIEAAGTPVAAPSANRSGRPSPTTAAHVYEDMNGRVPLILDGGPCRVGLESTVLDVTGPVPRVLRPGGITPEAIRALVGACEVDGAVMRPLAEGEQARSPGMKYRHYAPKGVLTLFHGSAQNIRRAIAGRYDAALDRGARPLILATEDVYKPRRTLVLGKSEADIAREVFSALRRADDMGADEIFCEAVEAEGLGLAIMNRLGRAAAFHIEEV